MHSGLTTESYKARVARRVLAVAIGCLLFSLFVALTWSAPRGVWDQDALLLLEGGALFGFWLACLSYLLQKSKTALFLLWTSFATGFVAAILLPVT